MSRLEDLRVIGIIACAGCERPFTETIPIKVGALFGTPKIERVPLCDRCVHGVWILWPVRK